MEGSTCSLLAAGKEMGGNISMEEPELVCLCRGLRGTSC